MPMKNTGSVPQGKKQKTKNIKKDKDTTQELKGIVAKKTDKKPGKNDPRVSGK